MYGDILSSLEKNTISVSVSDFFKSKIYPKKELQGLFLFENQNNLQEIYKSLTVQSNETTREVSTLLLVNNLTNLPNLSKKKYI